MGQNEIYGIQVADRLHRFLAARHGSHGTPPASTGDFLCLMEDAFILGILFISKAGLVLPCLSPNIQEDVFQAGVPLIAPLFSQRRVYCVSGWQHGVRLVRSALTHPGHKSRMPVEHRKYLFMCYDRRRCHRERIPPYSVTPCTLNDQEALYSLQSVYDTVEVLPKNHPFDPQLCRRNLQHALRLGNVVAISNGGEPPTYIAKATVSAISWRFIQIGGVYTMPSFRQKGYAGRLVQWLGDEAASHSKQATLFVRQENTSARHSYENAGYFVSGNYEIAYY